jgi:hypothetical protein
MPKNKKIVFDADDDVEEEDRQEDEVGTTEQGEGKEKRKRKRKRAKVDGDKEGNTSSVAGGSAKDASAPSSKTALTQSHKAHTAAASTACMWAASGVGRAAEGEAWDSGVGVGARRTAVGWGPRQAPVPPQILRDRP